MMVDLTGKTYGSLTAIRRVGSVHGNRNAIWLFSCSCGGTVERDGYSVRRGKHIDCATCAAERTRLATVKHGLSHTREFRIWTGMQTRCHNPNASNYPRYGGRGIAICDRWRSFQAFLDDMGPCPSDKHSIDRIDGRGNYEPGNCRWATAAEQTANRACTRLVCIDGKTKTIAEWAEQSGVDSRTIDRRLRSGWTGADLLQRSKRDGCLTFRGVCDTYKGWSKRTGIKTSTIAMRLSKYGWSVERTLTEGASL
jgi:hypothetical protein